MKFVIRSMSTTDFDLRHNLVPEPYHIYLRKPELRARAWWAGMCSETMLFDSIEAAQAEIDRSFPRLERYEPLLDIVPQNDRAVPTFWDARRGRTIDQPRARVVNDQIVEVAR